MPHVTPRKSVLPSFSALAGILLISCASLEAQTYAEVGDAGQSVATAQSTGAINGNSLTTITGSILTGTDVDLFAIRIATPTTFSATTTTGGLTILDTALFLFNSAGAPIYTNDDASGTSTQSTLPSGTSFTMSLSPGLYYLALSLSGNEPINSNGQLLFNSPPGGDSTAVRGAAGGINPNSLSSFNGETSFAETGTYQINLTATATAAIPEPSSNLLCLAAAAAVGLLMVRRRKAFSSTKH